MSLLVKIQHCLNSMILFFLRSNDSNKNRNFSYIKLYTLRAEKLLVSTYIFSKNIYNSFVVAIVILQCFNFKILVFKYINIFVQNTNTYLRVSSTIATRESKV